MNPQAPLRRPISSGLYGYAHLAQSYRRIGRPSGAQRPVALQWERGIWTPI